MLQLKMFRELRDLCKYCSREESKKKGEKREKERERGKDKETKLELKNKSDFILIAILVQFIRIPLENTSKILQNYP